MVVRVQAGRLLGRQRERAVLDRLLGTARNGHGSVLVVYGEPGVGKTALLGYAVESGEDFRIVRTVGVESPNVVKTPPATGGPVPTALGVTFTAPAPTVRVGGRVVVRVELRNDGTAPASLVQLQDRLPKNLGLVRESRGCGVDETRTVTCQIGTLAPQETAGVVLVLRALARGPAPNDVEVVDSYRLAVGTSEHIVTRTTVLPKRS